MHPSGSIPLDEGPKDYQLGLSKCDVIPYRHFDIEGRSSILLCKIIILKKLVLYY